MYTVRHNSLIHSLFIFMGLNLCCENFAVNNLTLPLSLRLPPSPHFSPRLIICKSDDRSLEFGSSLSFFPQGIQSALGHLCGKKKKKVEKPHFNHSPQMYLWTVFYVFTNISTIIKPNIVKDVGYGKSKELGWFRDEGVRIKPCPTALIEALSKRDGKVHVSSGHLLAKHTRFDLNMLAVDQWSFRLCQEPTCKQESQSFPAKFNTTGLCFSWEADQTEPPANELSLIMCQEYIMFCLLRQSKLSWQRPFISSVIFQQPKGGTWWKLCAFVVAVLLQLWEPTSWPTICTVCVSTVRHAVDPSGLLHSWTEKMAATRDEIHTSWWPRIPVRTTSHTGNTTQSLVSTGYIVIVLPKWVILYYFCLVCFCPNVLCIVLLFTKRLINTGICIKLPQGGINKGISLCGKVQKEQVGFEHQIHGYKACTLTI